VRRRLLALVGGLMAVVLLALGVPLAVDAAEVRTQRVFLDRLDDADRFVAVAEQGGDVSSELARYDEVYGIAVALLDRRGRLRAASRPGLGDEARRLAAVALAGRHGKPPRTVWPWDAGPLVVAEPVIDGGQVAGAVVTLSPTHRLRHAIARTWLGLGLIELIAIAVCVLLATRLTRWILRPVRDLDAAAHALATGRMTARALDGGGPPELRRLTGSFNRMAANVERLVEHQRSFVSDASHQLRNPLHALLLRLDSLALRAPEADAAAQEGRHLAAILERLLELAQAEEAAAPPERVDLAALADLRIAAWSAAAHAKRMTIVRGGEARAEALADPVALASALDVVLDNAVKFGPRGSAVHVTVERAAIAVRDDGPGLRPGELARAGDRFWRGRRHQNVDGSGLGLAIARTLLEHGGGRLELRAGVPRGLEARLCLGVAEPAQRRPVQRQRRGLDRGAAVQGGGGRDGAHELGTALEQRRHD
jgi:signal transduction histidine kinase